MNKPYLLILIAFLLVACSTTPSITSSATPILEKQITLSLPTDAPRPTITPNQEPSPTQKPSSTNTPTEEATATISPSLTDTPTVEASLFDIADCLPTNTLVQTGTVSQVFDGDTIVVLFGDGKSSKVRYIGIDAPESNMPFSTEAYTANSDMVLQKEVVLIKDVSETDPYDRLLRYVIVDGVFVNLELVKTGFAKAVQYPQMLPVQMCSHPLNRKPRQPKLVCG